MCLHSRLDRNLLTSPVLSLSKFKSSAEAGISSIGTYTPRSCSSQSSAKLLALKSLLFFCWHFHNGTIRVSNSERNGKYINKREHEIATPSSQFVQVQYVGESGWGLFTTKVIKSHVKLHVKFDAQKVNILH